MDTLSYKTKSANASSVERKWYVIDAEGEVLGRMCTQIASILRGKNKPTYTPHADTGDYIIVLNADKVRLTGNKMEDKNYLHYTGYPGGQRSVNAKNLNEKKPGRLVENAVRGMLPKNKLGRQMIKKLFLYAGNEHPHQAQNPEPLKIS